MFRHQVVSETLTATAYTNIPTKLGAKANFQPSAQHQCQSAALRHLASSSTSLPSDLAHLSPSSCSLPPELLLVSCGVSLRNVYMGQGILVRVPSQNPTFHSLTFLPLVLPPRLFSSSLNIKSLLHASSAFSAANQKC